MHLPDTHTGAHTDTYICIHVYQTCMHPYAHVQTRTHINTTRDSADPSSGHN